MEVVEEGTETTDFHDYSTFNLDNLGIVPNQETSGYNLGDELLLANNESGEGFEMQEFPEHDTYENNELFKAYDSLLNQEENTGNSKAQYLYKLLVSKGYDPAVVNNRSRQYPFSGDTRGEADTSFTETVGAGDRGGETVGIQGPTEGNGGSRRRLQPEQPTTSRTEQSTTSRTEQPTTSRTEQPTTSRTEQPTTLRTEQPTRLEPEVTSDDIRLSFEEQDELRRRLESLTDDVRNMEERKIEKIRKINSKINRYYKKTLSVDAASVEIVNRTKIIDNGAVQWLPRMSNGNLADRYVLLLKRSGSILVFTKNEAIKNQFTDLVRKVPDTTTQETGNENDPLQDPTLHERLRRLRGDAPKRTVDITAQTEKIRSD